MKKSAYETFRRKMSATMVDQAITIQELSDRLNVSRPGVSRVLNGHEVPSLNRAEDYAKAVGMQLHQLIKK